MAAFGCGSSNPSPCAAPPSTPASASLSRVRSGISRRSATEVEIDRAALNEILDHEPELMTGSRLVPEQENGNVVGVRLFGASPGSLLEALGVEDGDRIETINGADLSSGKKAMTVLASLRRAGHVTVVLNRRGKDMTIEYAIK